MIKVLSITADTLKEMEDVLGSRAIQSKTDDELALHDVILSPEVDVHFSNSMDSSPVLFTTDKDDYTLMRDKFFMVQII